MRPGKLATALLRLLIGLAAITAFAVLDWYPLVRELGGLRREQNDLKRKTADYSAMSSRFAFADAREHALLAGSDNDVLQALPRVEGDEAWETMVRSGLGEGTAGRGAAIARIWITFQVPAVAFVDDFALAADPGRFRWYGILTGTQSGRGPGLASRPLAIALEAPLPALLDFIERVSRGRARLEIVRLRLEPGTPWCRAWLACRGCYLSASPSRWLLPQGAGSDDGLLVDPDSTLLWEQVFAGTAASGKKGGLATSGGRGE